jgi:ComF family protein
MILFMLRELISSLVDIIYPKICLVCKTDLKGLSSVDKLICRQCWSKIKRNIPPFCHSCGRHLESQDFNKHICPACIKNPLYFDRAFSPCVYEGVMKELIHEFKYKNKDYLGHTLSKLMTEFIKEYDLPMGDIDSIVPIPLHKTRLREREFNQAQVLSNYIAQEFNKDLRDKTLVRNRYTRTQTELETDQRLLNVRGSFSVIRKADMKGKNILLVDDVLTTGATSSEAACVLKNAGANIVFVLTLAN